MTTESHSTRIEAAASQTASAPFIPAGGSYVINLCSSTTPMALRIPELSELKRFVFFVSRRREEGRERFRLHMGHFATLPEAEEWLGVVRELYPGAWAGEAPGKKLRAAQEAAAAVGRAAATAVAAPNAAPMSSAPAPRSPTRPPLVERRTVPRPPVTAAPPFPPPSARTAAPRTASTSARPPRPTAAAAPAMRPRGPPPAASIPVVQAARFAAPAPSRPSLPVAPPVPPPASTPAPATQRPTLQPSNVRQVLADLDAADDSGRTRQMPPPPVAAEPPARKSARPHAAARPAATRPAPPRAAAPPPAPARAATPPPPPPAPPPEPLGETAGLTDTQVLRMLERRRDAAAKAPPTPFVGTPEEIQLLRPDDLSTMTELRHGLSGNQQVFFAVQLEWSVQPIDLKRVPPLAIFSAYTLYTVEGNREDRKWYGLRLGFFSDSISAKQVALYVRSEFKSVAVIPVGAREKTRATEDGRLSSSALGQAHHREQPVEEFKLIDETAETPRLTAPEEVEPPTLLDAPPGRPARTVTGTEKGPLGQRLARARSAGREKTAEETLEETLEILGASLLSLDDDRKPLIIDNQARATSAALETTGRFAKLLERLSDRLSRGR
jgi:hypothetical protein